MWWIVGLLVAIALILLRILAAIEPIRDHFDARNYEAQMDADDARDAEIHEEASRKRRGSAEESGAHKIV